MVAVPEETLTLSPELVDPVEAEVGDVGPEAIRFCSVGVHLFHQGKYMEAQNAFNQAVEFSPNFAEAWNGAAAASLLVADHDRALYAADQAIKSRPDLPEAWHNKGAVLAVLGNYDEALKALNKSIKFRPDDPTYRSSRAVILAQLGRYQDALRGYKAALRLRPDDPDVWIAKGMALSSMERITEAQGAFEKAYQLRGALTDNGRMLWGPWSRLTLAQGADALLNNNIRAFEEAGLKYIDILEKSEQDGMDQVVTEATAKLKSSLKKKKELKAFDELELFIDLMKIKDSFEGWRAIGKAVSERWPKGLDCVQAVREIRR